MRLLDNVFSVWTDEFDHPQNFEKQNWDFDSAIELFYILLTFLNLKRKVKLRFSEVTRCLESYYMKTCGVGKNTKFANWYVSFKMQM